MCFNTSPNYVRLFKGVGKKIYRSNANFSSGFKVFNKKKSEICIISTGTITQTALEVVENLKEHKINACLIDLIRINPINNKKLLKHLLEYKTIITIEDNIYIGGIGSFILELLNDYGNLKKICRIAIKNEQCQKYGSIEWLHKEYKIDTNNIVKQILSIH